MSQIILSSSIGRPEIDKILQSVVGIFNLAFPARIRSYYIGGSYAIGNPVSTSDLDLCVMFKDKFFGEEEAQAQQLSSYCKGLCSVELDFALYTENRILQECDYGMGFATARQLIYGEEFTEPISLPPLEQYIRALMDGAYQVMAYIRSVEELNLPLNYPEPEGKFYGYDRPIHLRDGTVRAGTKQVVNNLCLAASAIVAHKAQYHVKDKHEVVRLYRTEIGDQWSDFIQELYEVGRNQWSQVIPEDEEAQRQFRLLCEQALEFERHFLTIYKTYLLNSAS